MHKRWTNNVSIILLLAGSVLLAACSGNELRVDEEAAFAPTAADRVAWLKAPMQSREGMQDETPLETDRMMRTMIAKGMKRRGIDVQAKGSQADWLIDYRLVERIINDQGGPMSPQAEAERAFETPGQDPQSLKSHNAAVPAQTYMLDMSISAHASQTGKLLRKVTITDIRAPGGIDDAPKLNLEIRVAKALEGLLKRPAAE